ncbi:MAG: peptide-methionine (S)-S-oxide reductase MsrA [Cyclobacteriaceae bacterium]
MTYIKSAFTYFTLILSVFFLSLTGCKADSADNRENEASAELTSDKATSDEKVRRAINYEKLDTATFAGGCFWCTETVFERVEGVQEVVSGYAGGSEDSPTYEQVSAGNTSHAEAVQVYYHPEVVSFEKLVEVFFKGAHDPTQLNRQGPDVGKQYRSVAFYANNKEKKIIENMIKKLDSEGYYSDPIVTQVQMTDRFWMAEDYHQDYYVNHPDNSYIRNVSKPKVEKFEKKFKDILKDDYPQ